MDHESPDKRSGTSTIISAEGEHEDEDQDDHDPDDQDGRMIQTIIVMRRRKRQQKRQRKWSSLKRAKREYGS